MLLHIELVAPISSLQKLFSVKREIAFLAFPETFEYDEEDTKDVVGERSNRPGGREKGTISVEIKEEGINCLRDEVESFFLFKTAVRANDILVGDVESSALTALMVIMDMQGHLEASFSDKEDAL